MISNCAANCTNCVDPANRNRICGRGLPSRSQRPPMANTDTASRSGLSVSEQIQRARELAASGDPRLASAEIVLDAASQELELALQQRPDAVFLVSLINRTHAQQRKLARLGLDAS